MSMGHEQWSAQLHLFQGKHEEDMHCETAMHQWWEDILSLLKSILNYLSPLNMEWMCGTYYYLHASL